MHLLTTYISKQILQRTIAVSAIILILITSARLVNYLEEVAYGSLRLDFALFIVLWRLPEFLAMILPLGFLIGLITTYNNFYANKEMVAMHACGMSENNILTINILNAILIFLLVASCSLFLSPIGIEKVEILLVEQIKLNKFDSLITKRFKNIGTNKVIYVANVNESKDTIEKVFLASKEDNDNYDFTIITAQNSYTDHNQNIYQTNEEKFLFLQDGNRYDISIKDGLKQDIYFKNCIIKQRHPNIYNEISREQSFSNTKLLRINSAVTIAELIQRLSIPMTVIIITLVATLLLTTNIRQKKISKLPIGIIFYLSYLTLISYFCNNIKKYGFGHIHQIWMLHIITLVAVIILYCYKPVKIYLSHRKCL